jgi:hypothetical protein
MHITTAAAAAVLEIDIKSVDNILSREGKHLIRSGKQGTRRRIDTAALLPIAVAIVLNRELGVPLRRGLEIGGKFLDSRDSSVAVGQLGVLSFDIDALRSHLTAVLAEVLEQTAPPKRGRPPRSKLSAS